MELEVPTAQCALPESGVPLAGVGWGSSLPAVRETSTEGRAVRCLFLCLWGPGVHSARGFYTGPDSFLPRLPRHVALRSVS